MREQMTLPPLPDPALTHDRDLRPLLLGPCFTADQLRTYAAQAVAQAVERCAALCDPTNADRPDDWTEYARVRAECAAAIRATIPQRQE